mgnify:CR=1 FL=1
MLSSTSFPGLFSAEEKMDHPLLGGEKPWEGGCAIISSFTLNLVGFAGRLSREQRKMP